MSSGLFLFNIMLQKKYVFYLLCFLFNINVTKDKKKIKKMNIVSGDHFQGVVGWW